jgi:uncharacterized lipoprotein YmbA
MKTTAPLLAYTCLVTASAALAGCSLLKPVSDPTRFFVLSATPPSNPPAPGPRLNAVLGLAPVSLPAHLLHKSLCVRKSEHEVTYADFLQWAEPLDQAVPNVIGQDLTQRLGLTHVRFRAWSRNAVDYEAHIRFSHFEADEQGRVILEAHWNITKPGGIETLAASKTRVVKEGPPPFDNPDGSVAALSDALSDLSTALAESLQKAHSGSRTPPGMKP